MSRKMFVSYEFGLDPLAKNLPSFFTGPAALCTATPIFVQNDVSAGGPEAIKREIKDVACDCEGAFFLVSDNVHNSRWIEHEGQLAIDKGWPVIFVRINNSTGGVPNVLRHYTKFAIAEWNPASVCAAMQKLRL